MRRGVTALALTFAVCFALVGCGKSSNAPAATGGDTGMPTTSSTCPTTTQKTLVKTRFAADIGLIVGTTKHFIYDPYKAGAFTKGAHHRILHIVKAGIAAAAVLRLTHNAIDNAKADPLLCKALVQPLTDVANGLSALKSKLKGGDLSAVTDLSGAVSGLESAAKGQGLSVVSGLIPGL